MKIKILFISVELLWFFCEGIRGLKISHKSNIWEEDFSALRPVDDDLEGDFYHDLKMGPEKLPIEVPELEENILDEETEKEKLTLVDEETIRKAEKEADKDLLIGLNRILKNNETLKDVLRTENIYKIP